MPCGHPSFTAQQSLAASRRTAARQPVGLAGQQNANLSGVGSLEQVGSKWYSTRPDLLVYVQHHTLAVVFSESLTVVVFIAVRDFSVPRKKSNCSLCHMASRHPRVLVKEINYNYRKNLAKLCLWLWLKQPKKQ